ncbi:helix-turn-helix transcriptional regulator [Streptomyces poonensis]|uniref:LuxR family transcriptional regulator n=1 Tax=Streptomyces poonensis TaxID=68255 RepID=A0A918PEK2_9ACTN|nr:helix-turn-helix transcriptional regulator [Streptomyces poonensis]GGZ04054.1 LuxR family transcriptional regulator [Streptomyces poonensis]GLJ90809.1 LuxR family transcriptional regulator [Streptomyces poonensis]
MLYGRDAELRLLSDITSRGFAGTGGALLLRGEAGIGKTALLKAAREAAVAKEGRALSALGVQSEASVPFAGLHQLLNPVLHDHLDHLMPRQRNALLAAFGVIDDAAPEMFSVGLASLELISGLADESPVILVIDDAQWIDGPSSEVLAFIARRLDAERAVMLLAVREGHDTVLDDAGLPELHLPRLDDDSAKALLEAHAPQLDRSLRDRLLVEAAGNPLALSELPAALSSQGGVAQTLMPWLPTTRRLERSFLSRASTLPDETQTVLLITAADDEGDLAEILEAAQLLDGTALPVASLEPAVEAGLLEVSGHKVRFRHPLIRSAIYHAAAPSRRLAGHAALAAVLARHQERRAWHRAAAAPGPDDDVALDLEVAAAKALLRGAPRAAAEALQQAALLSDPNTHRGRLLLRSAEINFELGSVTVARRQLAEAKFAKLERAERLRHTLWMEALNEESWFSPEQVRAFADVADQLASAESNGAALALRALWPLAIGCWYGNPAPETRGTVVRTARRLQTGDGELMTLCIAACADPVEEAAWVIGETARLAPGSVNDAAEQHALGASLTAIWAYDLSWPYLCAAVEGLRQQGRLGLLGEALASQAWAAILLGKHRLARTAADEARRLSRDTGRPRWAFVADLAMATLACERGEFDAANELIRTTEAELLTLGAQSILAYAQFARGRYAIVHHKYNDAFEQLARVLDPSDITYHPFVGYWAIADLIEAAVHTGRADEARRYFSQLNALAEKTTAPFLTAMAAYAHPLVAPEDEAESLYQRALDPRLSNWPFHRARLLLAYGRWLRRQRRLVEARRPLHAAMESFDALGIKAFGEDARSELRAAGEAIGQPTPDTLDKLTPQELQIAKMAASGMTNREIGTRLFISHRTVGQHLSRVFPKLGITSRGQLHLSDLGGD